MIGSTRPPILIDNRVDGYCGPRTGLATGGPALQSYTKQTSALHKATVYGRENVKLDTQDLNSINSAADIQS